MLLHSFSYILCHTYVLTLLLTIFFVILQNINLVFTVTWYGSSNVQFEFLAIIAFAFNGLSFHDITASLTRVTFLYSVNHSMPSRWCHLGPHQQFSIISLPFVGNHRWLLEHFQVIAFRYHWPPVSAGYIWFER